MPDVLGTQYLVSHRHAMQMSGSLYPAGLVDLPWNRVGVWAVVVWFMYSLKDFFGVSLSMICGSPAAHYNLVSSIMFLVNSPSFALRDLGGPADCHGNLCSLLHWEWLCEVCPEGSPLSSPDIASDPAEDPGIALCMWPLSVLLAVNTHNPLGQALYAASLNRSNLEAQCAQVLAYFAAIVSCVTLFGVMTIPDIIRESADFVTRLQSDSIWVVVLEKLRHGLG